MIEPEEVDPNAGKEVADELRRALRGLMVATLVLYLVLAGFGLWAWIDAGNRRADLAHIAVETNTALCALRADLEDRVAASERFLAANPDGIPGISAADIQMSISDRRRTIETLDGLDCAVREGEL